jgi:hypothetical protein
MRVVPAFQRIVFTLLAFIALAAIVSACRDSGGEVTGIDPSGRPRFAESYELDTLEVTACPGGTSGEYPHCFPNETPDFCTEYPNDPSCAPDPCTTDPFALGCDGGDDPCAEGGCEEYDDGDPLPSDDGEGLCPNCGEKNASDKQRAAVMNIAATIPCASMRNLASQVLASNSSFQVFTPWVGEVGWHSNGVIYINEEMFKADAEGDLAVVRSPAQMRMTLVHELAHYYWTYQQGYVNMAPLGTAESQRGSHHSNWQATMDECGY